MWFFKGILFLILLFVLAYFFITNSGQAVDLHFFGKLYPAISVYWVVVVSYLLGFLTSFLVAAFREFRLHRQHRGLRKEIEAKDREIAELRTLPLRNSTGDKPETDDDA
ncbi:LapA family protein [bacterium]|nr:LapA family protein [bacterium]PJA75470.1 MAG: hypothetical protein CO151_06295 [bacterium CG_4_9_14_3_um_filter_65_15]